MPPYTRRITQGEVPDVHEERHTCLTHLNPETPPSRFLRGKSSTIRCTLSTLWGGWQFCTLRPMTGERWEIRSSL